MENKIIKTKILKFLKRYLPYFILTGVVIYIFRYFFFDKGIATFVDTAPFNINMASLKSFASNLWVERYTGQSLYSSLPAYVQNFFAMDKIYSIVNFFTKNIYVNNTLWVFLPYPFFAVSVYFFVKHFIKDNWTSLLSAFLFIFSYVFFMWFITSGSNILVWAVSGSIWFCYSFLRALEANTNVERLKYAIIGALASLLAISNIAYFFTFAIFIALYYGMNLLINDAETNKRQLKNVVLWGVPSLLVNLFWLVPTLFMGTGDALSFGTVSDTTLAYHSSCATPVRNIMYMFCGSEPSMRIVYSSLFILLFALVAYFALVKKNKTNSILLIIFTFFYAISLGTKNPLWGIISHIPGSFLLRTPQRVFEIMLLIFITLVGKMIYEYRSKLLLVVMLLLVAVCARYYALNGENGSNMKDVIPASYTKVADFLHTNLDGNRLLIYPRMPFFMSRTWSNNKRISPTVIDYFLNEKVVMSWISGDTLAPTLAPLFNADNLNKTNQNVEKIMGFYNIKYILFQNDIKELYLPTPKEDFYGITKRITNNNLVIDTPELKVFGISDKYLKQAFYLPSKLVKVDDGQLLDSISGSDGDTAFAASVVADSNYGKGTIISDKELPSKYSLSISTASDKIFTVFQERYHPAWHLYAGGKLLESKYAEHIKTNGFENGWSINVKKYCQDFKCPVDSQGNKNLSLSAEFSPQKLMDFFLYFAYLLLGIMIGCYIIIKKDLYAKIRKTKK